MQPEVPPLTPSNNDHADLAKGLPSVVPPTGGHIAQMFLVPLTIVGGAVLLLLGFNWLAGGPRSAEEFLKGLRNPNPDVRWRTASDLAQILPRDERLASDPKFALDLAELLRQTLQENQQTEQNARALATQAKSVTESASSILKKLEAERKLIMFLSAGLGHFQIPVGVPLLTELAKKSKEPDAELALQRRQRAIWALANLGEKNQRYRQLVPQQRREAIEAALALESAEENERGAWAQEAARCLQTRSSALVNEALEQAANDPDLTLRKLAVIALNFWEGPHTEALLAQLADETGAGGEASSDNVRKLEIRYQATAALAQRGSPLSAKKLPVLLEMLDEDQQRRNFRIEKDGQNEPDQSAVQSTLSLALKAVVKLHEKQPDLDLSILLPAIDKLASNSSVTAEAKDARAKLNLPTT